MSECVNLPRVGFPDNLLSSYERLMNNDDPCDEMMPPPKKK